MWNLDCSAWVVIVLHCLPNIPWGLYFLPCLPTYLLLVSCASEDAHQFIDKWSVFRSLIPCGLLLFCTAQLALLALEELSMKSSSQHDATCPAVNTKVLVDHMGLSPVGTMLVRIKNPKGVYCKGMDATASLKIPNQPAISAKSFTRCSALRQA